MNVTKLLGNRLLIEPLPDETTAANGLIELPSSAQTKQSLGIVRMIGTGNCDPKGKALMDELEVGQKVKVDHSYGSVEVKIDGKIFRIHSVSDILAILC